LGRSSSELERWQDYLGAASAGLCRLAVTVRGGDALTTHEGFARWLAVTLDAHEHGRHVFFVGNGASAMMASHLAADACKNGALNAMAFNDAALLTATANDMSFDEVFAMPLSRVACPGDMLIAISSSGNSPNILRAVETARDRSTYVVTLTGKSLDNRARASGDLNFYVPLPRYGLVECAHQLILHYWLDQYLNLYGDGAI
jgi:D-sedoheptulose 7-phosphate isomerase